MSGWLLDTNVLSELRRPRPDPNVVSFLAKQLAKTLFVSCVTLAEIRFGIERTSDLNKRISLETWLEQTIRPMFDGRILDIDEAVMLRWRILAEEGRKLRHTFSHPDLLIAATALQHGLVILTRNTKDYERTGALFRNPWLL